MKVCKFEKILTLTELLLDFQNFYTATIGRIQKTGPVELGQKQD